jgi:hypothetical protein
MQITHENWAAWFQALISLGSINLHLLLAPPETDAVEVFHARFRPTSRLESSLKLRGGEGVSELTHISLADYPINLGWNPASSSEEEGHL